VFDQRSGVKLANSKLPLAKLAYSVPHGWLDQEFVGQPDPLQAERWFVASALIAGIIDGALELTAEHVIERQQFGKSLATFQAVQFPLAELKVWNDGVRLCALDTATQRDRGDLRWELSSALSWLNAVRAAERATKVCHQSFGALGFCNETGLVQLTTALTWLRLSVGVRSAQQRVLASRKHYLEHDHSTEPSCLVLEGFAV
jgi:alkylation response protein AidB-like acyl-CoA dehydrogenase